MSVFLDDINPRFSIAPIFGNVFILRKQIIIIRVTGCLSKTTFSAGVPGLEPGLIRVIRLSYPIRRRAFYTFLSFLEMFLYNNSQITQVRTGCCLFGRHLVQACRDSNPDLPMRTGSLFRIRRRASALFLHNYFLSSCQKRKEIWCKPLTAVFCEKQFK